MIILRTISDDGVRDSGQFSVYLSVVIIKNLSLMYGSDEQKFYIICLKHFLMEYNNII